MVEPYFEGKNTNFNFKGPSNLKNDAGYVYPHVAMSVARIGPRFNVSVYTIHRIIQCESGYYNIQSNIIKNGEREESYGVAQIHLPSHPEITKEQALDVDFSVEFIARELEKGNGWKWYGYNKELDKCN